MDYDPTHKPKSTVCPGQFCFCWQMGKVITSRTPDPLDVAEGCRCPFGPCTRLDPEKGEHDYFENHGPNLHEAGLPWFYFYPSPLSVVSDRRKQYIAESEALWGEKHWEK